MCPSGSNVEASVSYDGGKPDEDIKSQEQVDVRRGLKNNEKNLLCGLKADVSIFIRETFICSKILFNKTDFEDLSLQNPLNDRIGPRSSGRELWCQDALALPL
jgi:hypothetical protein